MMVAHWGDLGSRFDQGRDGLLPLSAVPKRFLVLRVVVLPGLGELRELEDFAADEVAELCRAYAVLHLV